MKNRTMRLAVLLLALTLITACFVGGTFAKYTSSANAKGTATVAKWDIDVNGTCLNTTTDPEISFNLFETAAIDTANDAAETDVAKGKIAPGTKGSFNIVINNKSEVNAEYDVAFTIDNTSNVPLTFKVGDAALTDITDKAIGKGASETIKVDWEWAFEGDHTDIGIAAPTVNVTAAITVDQVD